MEKLYEKEFNFGPGGEVTRDIEITKGKKRQSKFEKLGSYFKIFLLFIATFLLVICLIPLSALLFILNLIKDLISLFYKDKL
ncbi:hypothetical protein [Bordetella trematum]|uniref:hypothetical protein n=1 Tax=Bordetella trematum TaxID=123899 RepID=UPI003988BF0D